ncbi:alpha/beta fold hydrolase [Hymenobacter sp. BT175]|uniref:alpha/beta hydrolase n=1 Tax=Hymenobacter translucens TaxID=2886507 RepID=UPI001D0E2C94|nr:alpha/beta fold hydrolase [Hymenobacter translucens]MCC2548216.1 alpha/beta fold hydrolase [Hymenobacter translucens]
MKKPAFLFLLCLTLVACEKQPELSPDTLDGGLLFDASLYQPEKYLVSRATPQPTPAEAQRPVLIAVHGYSASTFEWSEFRQWAGGRTDFAVSQVLMGGHGRSYEAFKDASWRDWQASVIDEYQALERAGYRNISLVGSSTGCTVILEMLASGYFNSHQKPRQVLLVDPNVVPSDKLLTLVGVVGPLLGYVEADNTAAEDKYWYHYRPYETLRELRTVVNIVRKDLQRGFRLPAGTQLKVYKSTSDPTADPVSAVLIHKGVRTSDDKAVDVSMVNSDLHVFTRLDLRPTPVTAQDRENQRLAFEDIALRLTR